MTRSTKKAKQPIQGTLLHGGTLIDPGTILAEDCEVTLPDGRKVNLKDAEIGVRGHWDGDRFELTSIDLVDSVLKVK